MNSFFPILNWAGLLLLKEKLSHCTPYQEAERDSRAQWAAFKASHTATSRILRQSTWMRKAC